MVFCTCNIIEEKTVDVVDKKDTIKTNNLGQVTEMDTVYQIIVDRHYGWDKYNNKISKDENTEFKFIKKDANGNVTWESGDNRTIKTSNDSQGVKDTELYIWQN